MKKITAKEFGEFEYAISLANQRYQEYLDAYGKFCDDHAVKAIDFWSEKMKALNSIEKKFRLEFYRQQREGD